MHQEGNKITKAGVVLVMVLMVFYVAACATPGGRSAGQVLDDSAIATTIKTKLVSMPGVRSLGIDVDVHQGEVVLSGRVHSENEEARVLDATRNVQGVRKVTSMLKIIP
ncbi:MAG: BON domain-containing protein [Deltaproteobacteria bacterium]|nr:BON domain-containing protein [Candidatus Anaeroferrophillus wilburensis]MBN2888977.1 BON domain-containing protein [Deltaproteobacteria bacterium]